MQQERGQARLADRASTDRPREQCLSRREPELGAEHVHDAGEFRGIEQHLRLGGVAGERFLAEHMLAGADRFQHERRVRIRRGGDRHRVDAGDRERLGQAGTRVFDPEAFRARRGLLGIATHERVHLETGGAQCADMGQAPESRTDDRGPDGHGSAGIPAALATIESIVYCPTTNRISTRAAAS